MSKRTSFDRRSDPPLPLVEIPKQSRELLFQTFFKLHVSSMEPNRRNVKFISFQALSSLPGGDQRLFFQHSFPGSR